ncbi:cytochrome B [Wolbachia endosymbiont of Dipetalonema caudispina]|uniref:cytochrome b n=1 Tax=Wolbachia endosymbiont of Dipetalonema caudispina TaxID=1812112 RepID=UPI00158E7AE9|nr:cytochrome b [Wolbachia endosymbiont of Dipetalonema caudispina]QKX01330.1 cytochrome B [Wolbachia endosymbiont of Dipetalonema caudispina]
MATFITSMLCFGFYMKSLPANNKTKSNMYTVHKTCGITVFVLAITRIFFRIFTHIPPFPENFSRLEINVSKVIHFFLYFLMVLMPLSGYIMSSASGIKIKYLFHIPLLIDKNKELSNIANKLHSIFAYFMIFSITLHILGTLKHTFINKQNILKRII